jgi:hypothetical protein
MVGFCKQDVIRGRRKRKKIYCGRSGGGGSLAQTGLRLGTPYQADLQGISVE